MFFLLTPPGKTKPGEQNHIVSTTNISKFILLTFNLFTINIRALPELLDQGVQNESETLNHCHK